MFFSGEISFFPVKLVPVDGINPGPHPHRIWDSDGPINIPVHAIEGDCFVDPRQAPVVETAAEALEEDMEEEKSPPTPSMDHSDEEYSEMESEYSIDGSDGWALDAYPVARGEYYPTPVELTNEYMRLEDQLDKKHEAAVEKIRKMEEEREAAVEKLKKLEEEREELAAELQEAGTAHQQELEKLEDRRLSLL